MNCDGARSLLYLYRDGELSNRQADELLHHLHSCESCRLEKERIEEVESFARKLRSFKPGLRHPERLTSTIVAHIRGADSEQKPVSFFERVLDFVAQPQVRLASVAFILLLVGTFLVQFLTLFADIHQLELSATTQSRSSSTTGRSYVVEAKGVEQVTRTREFQSLVSTGDIMYRDGTVTVHQSDVTSFLSSASLRALSSTIASSFLHIDKKNLDEIVTQVTQNARPTVGIEH